MRLLLGLAAALGTTRALERLQRGWRAWRSLDAASAIRFESRAFRIVLSHLRRGWRAW